MERRKCRVVTVGGIPIGGDHDIVIQSMLNVPAEDMQAHVEQTRRLKEAGCQIVRLAVPTLEAVQNITAIKAAVDIPLVADIHFDYRIALACAEAGVDKIRINPGNIGDDEKVKLVADTCKAKRIPIRIGVNSGSVEKHILEKYGRPSAQAMCESALYHVALLEKFDFHDIIISIKSSDVGETIEAYRLVAQACNYPLHVGVTEAGTEHMGIIKSAAGIGSLLLDGIGDTIRVSLTADPVREVYAAQDILKGIGMSKKGVNLVSCPTCGRTKVDLISLASQVEERLRSIDKHIKVAVMGCAVNGPGEAREADIGIAGGDKEGLIFKKGEIIRKVPEHEMLNALMQEIEKL